MRKYFLVVAFIYLLAFLRLSKYTLAQTPTNWWDQSWPYRVSISVDSGSYDRTNKYAEQSIQLNQMATVLGSTSSVDLDSLRLVEYNEASIIDELVPFQFNGTNDTGILIFELTNITTANTVRTFHLYFDTASHPTASIVPQITFTDNILYQGHDSYKIDTPSAQYYFHKPGGGFASLIDQNGNDWIAYSSSSGFSGEYRGIPNAIEPEGGMHPGATNCNSNLTGTGPLMVSFVSTCSANGTWKSEWKIFPSYAEGRMTEFAHNYWFMYEGPPGGTSEPTDAMWTSDGQTHSANTSAYSQDFPGDEWVYATDANLQNGLFLAKQTNDQFNDYWIRFDGQPANNGMVVMAHGRNFLTPLFNQTDTFTLGFLPDKTFGAASDYINSSYKPLALSIDQPEALGNVSTPGDANADGLVNIQDFVILSNTFGLSESSSGYDERADFFDDNTINIQDFVILSNNFGSSG